MDVVVKVIDLKVILEYICDKIWWIKYMEVYKIFLVIILDFFRDIFKLDL